MVRREGFESSYALFLSLLVSSCGATEGFSSGTEVLTRLERVP